MEKDAGSIGDIQNAAKSQTQISLDLNYLARLDHWFPWFVLKNIIKNATKIIKTYNMFVKLASLQFSFNISILVTLEC